MADLFIEAVSCPLLLPPPGNLLLKMKNPVRLSAVFCIFQLKWFSCSVVVDMTLHDDVWHPVSDKWRDTLWVCAETLRWIYVCTACLTGLPGSYSWVSGNLLASGWSQTPPNSPLSLCPGLLHQLPEKQHKEFIYSGIRKNEAEL